MAVYIVILHYGKLEVTQKCIDSLAIHDKDFEEIVLINNDGSITLSKSQFSTENKKLHIINNKKNLGFAAGVNIGITYALTQKAQGIFLLNNDTVIEDGFLKKLVAVFREDERIGIAGPAIAFHKDGKMLYDLGGSVNPLIGRTKHHEVETIPGNYMKELPKIVTYVSGCCMLIKKEVFEKVGLFDEKFFLYSEDVDFSLRAKNAGFLSAVLPSVSVYHELSKSAGKTSSLSVYHQTKSGVIFGKKHCKIFLFNVAFLFLQSCLFFIKRRDAGIAAFKGLWDGLSSTI